MSNIGVIEKLSKVQLRVRNVCVIAHVDHGKTSLCDFLIASNGYISERNAGNFRYMDVREDEQERFITIKSSSMPLLHRYKNEDYVVNLVDSPGHADFSIEVAAAARLCDGALLVVDVLEGFASQTKMVLHQSWSDGVKLLLVLNKMDRLFSEVQLDPYEIYVYIRDLLERINASLHSCIKDSVSSDNMDLVDEIFCEYSFSPEKDNVIFASALDGWAFRLSHFCEMVVKRAVDKKMVSEHVIQEDLVQKLLPGFWGEYSLSIKTCSIIPRKGDKSNAVSTVVFSPLKTVYGLCSHVDAEALRTHIQKFNLTNVINDKHFAGMLKNPKTIPRAILSQWLPCSSNCLDAIVDKLPDPLSALNYRLEHIGGENQLAQWNENPNTKVLYIAKFMSADLERNRLTADKLRGLEKITDFVGFGRLFYGSISPGDSVTICREKESGDQMVEEKVVIANVYIPIGMDLHPVSVAPPGCIVAVSYKDASETNSTTQAAIGNTIQWISRFRNSNSFADDETTNILDTENTSNVTEKPRRGLHPVDRCVTLGNANCVHPMKGIYKENTTGILRFCIGPKKLGDWSQLLRGLALLYRADPAVIIEANNAGEIVLCCQGQVHSERIVQDLQHLYCPGVELEVSPPLIVVRETVIEIPKSVNFGERSCAVPYPPWKSPDAVNSKGKVARTDLGMTLHVRAVPIPPDILTWMDSHERVVSTVFHEHRTHHMCSSFAGDDCREVHLDVETCRTLILDKIGQASRACEWLTGKNESSAFLSICVTRESRTLLATANRSKQLEENEIDFLQKNALTRNYLEPLINGYLYASLSGPISEEPLRGVAFVIDTLAIHKVAMANLAQKCGMISGAMRTACRGAMQLRGRTRIYELMVQIEVQCEESVLGRVNDFLRQRRAVILNQEVDDRTMEFRLSGFVPCSEASNLGFELRRKSSGKTANIEFSSQTWLINEEDPFPECLVTIEQEEDEGSSVSALPANWNVARKLISTVRERKGLPTGLKIVNESANKQRTLGKAK